MHHAVIGGSVFRDTGPVEDERYAGATLIQGVDALSAVEGRVLEVAALVGEEDDDGVLCDALVGQCLPDPANRVIDRFHHGGVLGGFPLEPPGLEVLHVVLAADMGGMDVVVPERHHERLIPVISLDEFNGAIGEPIGQVTIRLLLQYVFVFEVVRVVAGGCAPVCCADLPIEALVDRVIRLGAKMPFAEEEVVVVQLLQRLGIGDVLQVDPVDTGELSRVGSPEVMATVCRN